jgi:Flp pilus assembly secretin CpaC
MNSDVCGGRLSTTLLGYSKSGADTMHKTRAYCRSAAVMAFILASTTSATHAQESTSTKNVVQQSALSEQEEKGVSADVTVMPGFIKKYELKNEFQSIHIGDESVATVMPITNTSILVEGKKIGKTSVNLLGANGKEVAIFNVKVDPLPDSKMVEVYDSKTVVHNWVSYECIEKFGCGYPEAHDVKPEDLPKGYTHAEVTPIK